MSEPEPAGRSVDETIGLNFQGNQIRVLSGKDGMMASGSLKIEEDLTQYSQAFSVNPWLSHLEQNFISIMLIMEVLLQPIFQ